MTIIRSSAKIFSPFQIGSLTLRNRIIRSGCFEGMCQDGEITDRLIEHHRRVAQGGVGMTTVAYCSVSFDGRAFGHEMWIRPEILPGLRKLTATIHSEGAAVSIQIGHCGFFASPGVIRRRPLGASPKFCLFRLSYCSQMTTEEIEEKTLDFIQAALWAKEVGFDAVEVHSGHGYLLSQFLSPWTNHRSDEYGGSLENRSRFPVDVIRRVRDAVGDGFPILVKMNQSDGIRGGLEIEEAIEVAKMYESAGASVIVPSCGFTAKTPLFMMRGNVPTLEMARAQDGILFQAGLTLFGWGMVQHYPFTALYLLEGARKFKDALGIPVAYIGGVLSIEEGESLVAQGFDLIEVGRATVRDPDFVKNLKSGAIDRSDCDHCNRCIATMSVEGVKCVSLEKGFMTG